jgi:hypothetical protein
MVVISGVELVQSDNLLWAAQRGSERLRLIADSGVQVRRVGERVYVAHALPMPATRTVRLMPETKYRTLYHLRIDDRHRFGVTPADAQLWSDSIGGVYASASGCAAAQMSIIRPPAYVSVVRKHKLIYQLHYIALLPRGELREMGTKREVLLLAKTGEPLALQLARLLWEDDDFLG